MPSHGLRWILGATAAAVLAVGACGYPAFTYNGGPGGGHVASSSGSRGDSVGGMGGQPTTTSTVSSGGSGGATASTSTATSSSTGSGGPTVPCTETGKMCKPQEVCCFHNSDPNCDECTNYQNSCGDDEMQKGCGASDQFSRLSCNEDADCPESKVCCYQFDGSTLAFACFASCDFATTFPVCDIHDDMCPNPYSCQFAFTNNYPGYYACQ
jgi:hypothetical protein